MTKALGKIGLRSESYGVVESLQRAPSNQYENAGTAEMEVYPADYAYNHDYVCEIWIPLKRKLQ